MIVMAEAGRADSKLTISSVRQATSPEQPRIQARLDEDLALERLARLAGLSRFHFLRQFRALTGETPKQYVLRLRIERSALRLLLVRSSVLDVALDCGFHNHETFTRAFRRRFGTSPRDYRTSNARVDRPTAIYSANAIDPAHELNQTDLCVRVVRASR